MNIAIITAGGIGSRMSSKIPKQFLCVHDKPVIVHTLEIFQTAPDVDAIAVACLDGWENMLAACAEEYGIAKLKWMVRGGATGFESIRNAIRHISLEASPDDLIIVHDGNRMNLPQEIIPDAILTCRKYGSAVPVVPCVEAMLYSPDHCRSDQIIPRNELFRTQTPQVFPLKTLLWAFEEAEKRGIHDSVACCTLMIELGRPVRFFKGSELNIKITTADDILMARALLELREKRYPGDHPQ